MGFPSGYIYLVQSTSHSVFVGLMVRVRYVHTHLLGFQHHPACAKVYTNQPRPWAVIFASGVHVRWGWDVAMLLTDAMV
jgi:hypothetical protein